MTQRPAAGSCRGRSGTSSTSGRSPGPSSAISLDGWSDGHRPRSGRPPPRTPCTATPVAKSVSVTGRPSRIDATKSISAVQPARSSSRIATAAEPPPPSGARSSRCAAKSTSSLPSVAVERRRVRVRAPLVRADISIVAVTSSGYSAMDEHMVRHVHRRPGRPVPRVARSPSRVTAVTAVAGPSQRAIASYEDPERHDVLAAVPPLPAPDVTRSPGPLESHATRTCRTRPIAPSASSRRIVASAHNENDAGTTIATRSGWAREAAQHRPGLVGGRGHPRLGQDVLAGLERGDRDRRVEVGPRPDEHGIDPRVGDEGLPVVDRARDPQLGRRPPRRLRRPIGDGDELDAIDRPEPRDVLRPHDPAGPDDPDPDRFRSSTPSPFVPPATPSQPSRRDTSSAAARTTAPALASPSRRSSGCPATSRSGRRRPGRARRGSVPRRRPRPRTARRG